MTSAFSATFGGMAGGTVTPGGRSWFAVVQETFNVYLAPLIGMQAVLQPGALTLTPHIGMFVLTNASASVGLNLTPKIGVTTPVVGLTLTPTIHLPATYTYGPEMFGLVLSPIFAMATVPEYPPHQINTTVSRAATI